MQEQISEVEDRMRVQSTKYGEQLAQLAQEIASLGKTIVPEEKKGEFEVLVGNTLVLVFFSPINYFTNHCREY